MRAIHPKPFVKNHKNILFRIKIMVKRPKRTSTHLSILLFAQNSWNHHDRKFIEILIHKMLNALQASFLIGTTDVKNEKCFICAQLFDLLKEIQGLNDARLFISHNILDTFYIHDSDNRDEMVLFTNQIFTEKSIKKFYILQVGSFIRKTSLLRNFNLNDHLTRETYRKTEFLSILNESKFENNTLYEILRDSYS